MFNKDIISGLFWDESFVQFCQVRNIKNDIFVLHEEKISLNLIKNSTDVEINEKINLILADLKVKYKIDRTKLIIALPQYQVFMKNIWMPSKNAKEIKKMLYFEAEKYIPYPVEDAIFDFYSLQEFSKIDQNKIMFIAAKKTIVYNYLDLLKKIKLVPTQIIVSSIVLSKWFLKSNLFDFNYDVSEIKILLSLNMGFWEINFFDKKNLLFSRGLKFFSKDFELKQDEILSEIENSIISFKKNYSESDYVFKEIFVAGENEFVSVINKKINEKFFEKKIVSSCLKSKNISLIAFCLATNKLNEINLIPTEIQKVLITKIKRKKIARYSIIFIILIFLLFGFYFFSNYNDFIYRHNLIEKIEAANPEMRLLESKGKKLNLVEKFSSDSDLPLKILNEVDLCLPSNAYILQFRYDSYTALLNIKGRTNSYKTVSSFIAKLLKSKFFLKVVNKEMQFIKIENNTLVDFEIECEIKINTNKD